MLILLLHEAILNETYAFVDDISFRILHAFEKLILYLNANTLFFFIQKKGQYIVFKIYLVQIYFVNNHK